MQINSNYFNFNYLKHKCVDAGLLVAHINKLSYALKLITRFQFRCYYEMLSC